MILDNICAVSKRISHASMRAGRSPDEVTLVAVTKNIDIKKIQEAIDAGLRIFGENRVQEANEKIQHLRKNQDIVWHFVGTLQKNKARKAVEMFDVIESVDSLELLQKIDRCAKEVGKVQHIFIQVKVSDEKQKHGIAPPRVTEMLERAADMGHVTVDGLMTVPPYHKNAEDVRPYYQRLKKIKDNLLYADCDVKELSMGMSHDFEIAIEEGATVVRIGTAIFGERVYT